MPLVFVETADFALNTVEDVKQYKSVKNDLNLVDHSLRLVCDKLRRNQFF